MTSYFDRIAFLDRTYRTEIDANAAHDAQVEIDHDMIERQE